jgi:hypothetical protein
MPRHISELLPLPKQYVLSCRAALRQKKRFENVGTYFMFIGYPRSGHSLIGSLLDAHPNIVCAHELGVLRYLLCRFRRDQIFSLLLTANG